MQRARAHRGLGAATFSREPLRASTVPGIPLWWVKIRVDGRPVYESSKSTKKSDAIKLRDKLLSQKHRGELSGDAPDKVLIGELLDDVLKSDIKDSTLYVWKKVIEKNIRPFFGKLRAQRLSTDQMDKYREVRKAQGRSDATVNRELSVMRTAFHNARKRTPPKVNLVPYFPMVAETNVRKGFLTDEQYAALRSELPADLKALFVTAYITGIRKGELTGIQWPFSTSSMASNESLISDWAWRGSFSASAMAASWRQASAK
jgi:hypothetical protein